MNVVLCNVAASFSFPQAVVFISCIFCWFCCIHLRVRHDNLTCPYKNKRNICCRKNSCFYSPITTRSLASHSRLCHCAPIIIIISSSSSIIIIVAINELATMQEIIAEMLLISLNWLEGRNTKFQLNKFKNFKYKMPVSKRNRRMA